MPSPTRELAPGGGTPGAELSAVRFHYDREHGAAAFGLAVDELALHRGEAVACIGPSGSGKTTLVHLCAGILAPSAGEITLGGTRIDGMADAERRRLRAKEVGLVFQEFELLDYLSGLDNILLPFRLGGSERSELREARARAESLAGVLGIDHLMGRRPARMSQGERQRVAIARALVTEPSLVLCDEPTGNLDPKTAGSVLDLLLGEARNRGAALLMVTHDHTLLGRFDRVIDVRDLHHESALEGQR